MMFASATALAVSEDSGRDENDLRKDSGHTRPAVLSRKPGLRTSTVYTQTALAYIGATAILMPIIEPPHVAAILPKADGVVAWWAALVGFRNKFLFGFLCAHELVNDLASDVVAQAFTLDRNKVIAKDEKRLVLQWRRVMRSMSSAMLSDDLPFLIWSRAMWSFSEWATAGLRSSASLPARLVSILTHPIGMGAIKMLITQLVYEPTSTAAYLAMQALLKGQGWKGVRSELRTKFFSAFRDGMIYWSVALMVVFMMPFWWLQPITDNLATLFFNSYLSMLSNDGDPTSTSSESSDEHGDEADQEGDASSEVE